MMTNEQKLEAFDSSPAAADAAAQAQPARTIWRPKVGDKAFFTRGMFGIWKCTIRRLYQSRGDRYGFGRGEWLAEVSFAGRNGRHYLRPGVRVQFMTQNGVRPTLPKEH